MRIFHRVSADKDRRREFLDAGVDLIDFEDHVTKFAQSVVFRIDEADPRWPKIEKLLRRGRDLDLAETEFSDEELKLASNNRFLSKSFSGYPEPSDDFGYREITYDLTEYCLECGIGLRQKAPFRLAKEPTWGRCQTFQLHWTFDEIFVNPDTWESVFRPLGIGYWPVESRSGKVFDSVLQLKIDAVVDLHMPAGSPKARCRMCGRTKFLPLVRGFWPQPIDPVTPIFKSEQYFGDGHAADRDMFISQKLYRSMLELKLNCKYWACSG